jgi:hypothetical protein
MVPIVFGRRSEASDSGVPRVNVVAIAVLLGAIVFAVIGSTASGNPIPLLVMILVGVVLMQAPRIAQAAPPRLAVPVKPVTAIVDALRSHDVVAMGAGHGEERGYALGLSLVP